MKKLNLKLLRDIYQIKAQIITVGLVIATGILYMVGSLISYDTLLAARDSFYKNHKLANAFHYSQNAPRSLLRNISQLPGIIRMEDRLSEEVSVDFPGERYPTTGTLLSLTEELNTLYLESGRLPSKSEEVVINTAFAKANHLKVGSSLVVIVSGRRVSLNVSGIALSPEFVYIFRPGSLLPDDKHYGIFWMNRNAMEAITNKEGSFNHILFEFSFSGESQRKEVWEEIKSILKPYGSLGVQSIGKLPSYSLLQDEFKQLRTTALFIPIIFLSVAAFLLHIVMSRLIAKEREQIATFKAIGMNAFEIGLHYFKLTSIISMSGTILGLLLGIYLGDFFRDLYSQYFKFPELNTKISISVLFLGLFIGLSSGFVGFWASFRRIIKMDPAVAMRPPMPESFRTTIWESILSLEKPQRKMLLRNLIKSPVRTLFIITGLSFAVMIMILGNFMKDTIGYMMELQFDVIQRESMSLSFIIPRDESIVWEISNKKEVLIAEGSRSIPVRINYLNRFEEAVLQGLEDDSQLRRVLNESFNQQSIPRDGLLMNRDLAQKLGIQAGDSVLVEALEGKQNEFQIQVVGLVNEILGQGIYIERKSLNRLLGEGYVVNQIFMKTDSRFENSLMEEWRDSPILSGMGSKTQLVESFSAIMERSMQATSVFILIFTGIIGVGVIYNTAMITLSERLYELGSLRILGFRLNEIFSILFWELFSQILISLPLGCWLGYELSNAVLNMNDTEGFRLPAIILPSTYASAVLFTFATAFISFILIYKKLKNMDLLSVLKIRE